MNKQIANSIIRVSERHDEWSALQTSYQQFIHSHSFSFSEQSPMIYLYNSHPLEEYLSFSGTIPKVGFLDYVLQDFFTHYGCLSIVEEQSVAEVLEEKKLKMKDSYQVSRVFLENALNRYPSLQYFIDIHRDSPTEDTHITIDGKEYAKVLFVVGMDHEHWQENYQFIHKLHQELEVKYPGISKGIMKKSGEGVDGIYNQDFSSHVVLLEMGGITNTIPEVLNSILAFGECFLEIIKEKE